MVKTVALRALTACSLCAALFSSYQGDVSLAKQPSTVLMYNYERNSLGLAGFATSASIKKFERTNPAEFNASGQGYVAQSALESQAEQANTASQRSRDDVNIEEYKSLETVLSAIGSSQKALVIPSTENVTASTIIPRNVTLRLTGSGQLYIPEGVTLTINGPIEAPLRQIFSGDGKVVIKGNHVSRLYPQWWGAEGDGTTDDTAAIQATLDAAVNGGLAAAVVCFPAGTYKVTRAITAGMPGSRASGLTIEGAGRFATTLEWYGSTSDTLLRLLNTHMSTVRDIRLLGKTRGGCGLWFDVQDGQSGFMPRTDNVYIGNFAYGLQIGGGKLLSTGECNAGLHNNLYITDFDEAVRITGANVEVQTFVNFFAIGEGARVFHTLNGRGIYVLSGEAALNHKGNNVQWFLEASGGNINGGGYYIGNMRIEGLYGLAYFNNSGASGVDPITFVADQVIGASAPVAVPGPVDVIRLAGPGSVTVRNCIFPREGSRFFFEDITDRKYVSFNLEGCQINNSTANADPSTLVHVTSPGRGATGGVEAILLNNTYIESSQPFRQIGRLADRLIRITPDEVGAPSISAIGSVNNKEIKTVGGATATNPLSATTPWNPPSIADDAIASTVVNVPGAAQGDTVAVGFSQSIPAGALLFGAVTGTNRVAVTLLNKTGKPLNLGAGTLRVDVWQH